MNQPSLLVAVDDLFFLSKIQAAARQMGVTPETVHSSDEVEAKLLGGQSIVIVDLSADGFSATDFITSVLRLRKTLDLRIVGFFSHTRLELKQRAESLGCDLVVPKSRLISELPSLLTSGKVGR